MIAPSNPYVSIDPIVALDGVRERMRDKLVVAVALVVPISVVLGASIARTEYHTEKFGLVSTNGAFNIAFGRCHAVQLTASQSRGGTFTPPAFNALAYYEDNFGSPPLIPLDPALGRSISFDGNLWDEAPALDLAKKCVAQTGPLRRWLKAGSRPR